MPELPEVETTRRGIDPLITGQIVKNVIIRQPKLRWLIPSSLKQVLPKQKILSVSRRGKYLLINATHGTVIIHLGMSGNLRVLKNAKPPAIHDHFDIVFNNKQVLRFHDPRRFGAVLWTTHTPIDHPLLRSLGPEPLDDDFNADYIFKQSRNRKVAIKSFIMNSKIVVGIGNIYANEALFRSGINPSTKSGKISKKRSQRLVCAIKEVLQSAIKEGGTTLRDFTNEEGKPGYFSQKLLVYGRAGKPCTVCGRAINQTQQNQRMTYYCSRCQR